MKHLLANQAELIIAKHRNGSIADVRLSFHGSLAKFSDLDIFGNYQTSGFAQQDEPGGFEKLRISVDPGAAFGVPDNGNVSGSAMNDDEDEKCRFKNVKSKIRKIVKSVFSLNDFTTLRFTTLLYMKIEIYTDGACSGNPEKEAMEF